MSGFFIVFMMRRYVGSSYMILRMMSMVVWMNFDIIFFFLGRVVDVGRVWR